MCRLCVLCHRRKVLKSVKWYLNVSSQHLECLLLQKKKKKMQEKKVLVTELQTLVIRYRLYNIHSFIFVKSFSENFKIQVNSYKNKVTNFQIFDETFNRNE